MDSAQNEVVDFSFDEVVAQLEPDNLTPIESTNTVSGKDNFENASSKENYSEKDCVEDSFIESETSNFILEKNEDDFEKKDNIKDSLDESDISNSEFEIVEKNDTQLSAFIGSNDSVIEKNDSTENDNVVNENFDLDAEQIVESNLSSVDTVADKAIENDKDEVEIPFNPLDSESVGHFLEDIGVDAETIEKKKSLIEVMEQENELLDKILETQNALHQYVREKNWDNLNEQLEGLQSLSDDFAELEEKREELSFEIDLGKDIDFSPVLAKVRGKLQKSKIENHALNEYISTARKFLQGVFDSVVPQRRNVLYSKNGKIVRPEISGVAININL